MDNEAKELSLEQQIAKSYAYADEIVSRIFYLGMLHILTQFDVNKIELSQESAEKMLNKIDKRVDDIFKGKGMDEIRKDLFAAYVRLEMMERNVGLAWMYVDFYKCKKNLTEEDGKIVTQMER